MLKAAFQQITDKVNKDLHKGEDEVIQKSKEKLDEIMEKNAKQVISETLPPLPGSTDPGQSPLAPLPAPRYGLVGEGCDR